MNGLVVGQVKVNDKLFLYEICGLVHNLGTHSEAHNCD